MNSTDPDSSIHYVYVQRVPVELDNLELTFQVRDLQQRVALLEAFIYEQLKHEEESNHISN